jgi:hypothetical protein
MAPLWHHCSSGQEMKCTQWHCHGYGLPWDVTVYSETIQKHFEIVLWSKHLRSGQWRRFETSTCSGREEEGEVSCDLMQEPCHALPIQPPVRKQWPKMTLKVPLRSVVRSRPDVQDTMEMHIVSYCISYCIILSAKSLRSFENLWDYLNPTYILGIWLFNAVHVLCMPYESLWIPMTFWSFYVLKCCEANSAVCSVSISLCRRLAAPWRQKRFWRCHLLGRWIGMNQELGRSGQNPWVAPWVINYISQT